MNRAAVPIEKRNVSKARREKHLKASDGICARSWCERPASDVDHIIPLWCGGSNRDSNLEALCVDCHALKTKAEASARAKVNRIEKKAEGRMKPKRPIGGQKLQSRGFDKSRTKTFSGKVRPRSQPSPIRSGG